MPGAKGSQGGGRDASRDSGRGEQGGGGGDKADRRRSGGDDPGREPRKMSREKQEEFRRVIRESAQQYLRLPNVTSVGVGYRMKNGKPTDELTVQFTVARKLAPESLKAAGQVALPATIKGPGGTEFPVDVIERSYKPSHLLLDEEEAEPTAEERRAERHATRRERLDPIVPGVSISHHAGSAGTAGLIVYDEQTGEPYVLSNWHVLQGPGGRVGDAVVQPGPFDDPDVGRNISGRLVRSHLGVAGDCAVASIEGRQFETAILGLDVTPRRVARAELGDRVVKSGRTTDVTRGIVSRVEVVVNLDYGPPVGVQQVGGFEITPDPANPPDRGEISEGGDSGSAWMIDAPGENGDADGGDGDVIVGLHFAGETDPDPAAEHAVACNIHSVLKKLKVTLADPAQAEGSERQRWEQVSARIDLLWERLAAMESKPCGCQGDHGGAAQPPAPGAALTPAATEAGLPIYGNWCGPGHGGGTPVDDVDRACMNHDNCYGRRGYFDCTCDTQLVRELDGALRFGRVRPWGRVMGPVIRRWFQMQPCRNGRESIGLGLGAPPPASLSPGATAGFMVPGVPPSVRDVGTAKVWRLGYGDRGPD